MSKKINVQITYTENKVIISSKENSIELYTNSKLVNKNSHDFAVWLFLPIAMKLNCDLHIEGTGSPATVDNAKKMSQIWSTWMPNHFHDVSVTFDKLEQYKKSNTDEKLCFYSGGIDSTYMIAQNEQKNLATLLTIHGMDYSHNDDEKFNAFIKKTNVFSEKYSKNRIFIKTNAYDIYNKFKINTKQNHISHIFALAGCGFLFSEHFDEILIAADYRLDQQFFILSWGSNTATNVLFDDGKTKLTTRNDNITRSEKMPFMDSIGEAINSLTFCVDKKSRPENCGICSKCIRTKLMFLAATGKIPDIFKTNEIPKNPFGKFSIKKPNEQAFIMDLYFCAKNNNRLDLFPELEKVINKIKNTASSFFSFK